MSHWVTPSPLSSTFFKSAASCITPMGRTIPSFRIPAEMERMKWRPFRSMLNRRDRKEFDQMFSYVRFYNSACMMQASPVVCYSVLMSILYYHYKQLMELTGKKKRTGTQAWIIPEAQNLSNTTLDRYCKTKY
jgi:hypothetical protein